jgi:hypothetical protein
MFRHHLSVPVCLPLSLCVCVCASAFGCPLPLVFPYPESRNPFEQMQTIVNGLQPQLPSDRFSADAIDFCRVWYASFVPMLPPHRHFPLSGC